MNHPGDWLRGFARRFCAADTMARVIDPLIADLQLEDAAARQSGRIVRRVRVRLAGYLAFWQTVTLCAGTGLVAAIGRWLTADESAVLRTIGWSAAVIASLTLLLALLPLSAVLRRADGRAAMLFVLVIPQAIPLSVVFGLPIGVLAGLRGRRPTRRTAWSVVALAGVAAALTFIICAWILPEANQAFRAMTFNQVLGRPGFPMRGANELTFTELGARIAALTAQGRTIEAQAFLFSYHSRLAASAAPLVWGIFALAVSRLARRTATAIAVCIIAAMTYVGYAILVLRAPAVTYPWVPIGVAMWLPNVLFALLTVLLWVTARSRAETLSPRRP